jgi:hypothetical protein
MTTATGNTSTYHHGNLRDTLLATAIAQLAQQSDAALSLRELARTAGVSVAAVYRHFPSKEALLAGRGRLRQPGRQMGNGIAAAGRLVSCVSSCWASNTSIRPGRARHYRLMFEHQDVRQFPVLQTAAQACFQYVLQTAGAAVREAGADPGAGRRQRRLVAGPRLRDAAPERPPGHDGRRRRAVAGHGAALFPIAGGALTPAPS